MPSPGDPRAFRWGPGTSRFLETKRTNDKPISPLIALDQERCILCYRCGFEGFWNSQLIARERGGAKTHDRTFEGRPSSAGHFHNNIVGWLVAPQLIYRFRSSRQGT